MEGALDATGFWIIVIFTVGSYLFVKYMKNRFR